MVGSDATRAAATRDSKENCILSTILPSASDEMLTGFGSMLNSGLIPRRLILVITPVAILFAANGQTSDQIAAESKRANEFFDKCWSENLGRHPLDESFYGIKTHYQQLEDLSDQKAVADHAVWERQLATLKRDFRPELLDPQTRLSYKLFEREAEREAEEFTFRFDVYPVTQRHGMHTEIPTFLINVHKVDNARDAEAYVARLNAIPKLFDQVIVNLRAREDKGVIAPCFVFPLVLDACHKVIQGKPFDPSAADSPLLSDFTKKISALSDVDAATKNVLLHDATKALTESVKPAYLGLIAFLEEQSKRAKDDAGVWKFADGEEFYRSRLRNATTTNLSAERIYEIGLKDVARIQNEMVKIKEKVGFKGDLQAFFKFMREDKRFYLPDTDEGRAKYLARAVGVIDEMKSHLGELFVRKPKADLVVKAVEKFREHSAGHASYQRPAPDGSRPGIFYVNLRDMQSNPTYQLEALAYHEGIPGHHMQTSIAQELTGVPKFRKFSYSYSVYTEGWGLYSELLSKEIGMYRDPYSDFGRLALELGRAARLVVDTGLHGKRWTRQQAIDYLKQNTPNSERDCIDSINRYLVTPGQATTYTIGMKKILELRERAKKRLGEKFDTRQFHDAVLANGALPLDALEGVVERWIEAKQSGGSG